MKEMMMKMIIQLSGSALLAVVFFCLSGQVPAQESRGLICEFESVLPLKVLSPTSSVISTVAADMELMAKTESEAEEEFNFQVDIDKAYASKLQHYVDVKANGTARQYFEKAEMGGADKNNCLKWDGAIILEKLSYLVRGKTTKFFQDHLREPEYIGQSMKNLRINKKISDNVFNVTTNPEEREVITYDLEIDHYNIVKDEGPMPMNGSAGSLKREYVEKLLKTDQNLGSPIFVSTEAMANPQGSLYCTFTLKKYYSVSGGKDTLIVTYSIVNIKTGLLRPFRAIRHFVMQRPHQNKEDNIQKFKNYLMKK